MKWLILWGQKAGQKGGSKGVKTLLKPPMRGRVRESGESREIINQAPKGVAMPLPETAVMFSGNPLNRAGDTRHDAAWLTTQLDAPEALFVPFWHLRPLIFPVASADTTRPVAPADTTRDVGWLPRIAFGDLWHKDCLHVFLGLNRRGKPLFAVDISHVSQPEEAGVFRGLGTFDDVRELALLGDLSRGEFAILAQAKAMLHWHNTHAFCGKCGSATDIAEGGYKRICTAQACEHFPRTDPVVIMLAIHDDACLLGRQKNWPEHMFSALAGFMEPGETIEEAVARELHEEAGIDINGVHYVASQPWAFPSSLMIGCLAQASGRDIVLDGQELEAAKWVARADVKAALNNTTPEQTATAGKESFHVPPPMAIARQLIEAFAADADKAVF